MSLTVNLSSVAIRDAYEAVLDGAKDYLVLTYEKSSNDLRVQVVEKGDLDDLNEEFSDGRIQYAFVRVKDPNSQLPKFALISWCGEGVPENRKGLFSTHSSAVAQYLKAYHVNINARSEADVDPKLIMRRIAESSGSNYSAAGQAANTHTGGPITAVGSSYKPVGTPDIRGMQKGAPKDTIAPVGSSYAPKKDELQQIRSGAVASSQPPSAPRVAAPAFDSAPAPSPAPAPAPAPAPVPAPTPAAPPAPVAPQAATPGPAVAQPQKPSEDDRIQPVGTSYQPVSLGKPGKLNMANRFPFGQQDSSAPAAVPAPRVASAGNTGKLTWSQRQEAARKEREEEEARVGALSSGMRSTNIGGAPSAPAAPSARSVPSAPVVPKAPSQPTPPAAVAPPEPIPEPEVAQTTQKLENAQISGGSDGLQGKVTWAYEAAEDNELTLVEGATISNIEQLDEGWWSGVDEQGNEGLFPASYVELTEAHEVEPDASPAAPPAPPAPPSPAVAVEPEEEDDIPPPPPPPPAPPAPPAAQDEEIPAPPPPPPAPPAPSATGASSDKGLVCTALYGFDASEENELSFAEGDTLIHVDDKISEDWWSGTNESTGEQGLFPANYVELA